MSIVPTRVLNSIVLLLVYIQTISASTALSNSDALLQTDMRQSCPHHYETNFLRPWVNMVDGSTVYDTLGTNETQP